MADTLRPGEVQAPIDPDDMAGDGKLVFIGRAQTPWKSREACPKNLGEARARAGSAAIAIDPDWRLGLRDLKAGEALIVLTWLDRARRDVLIQAPRHRDGTAGVFSLRSPVRPNPVGLHVVRVLSSNVETGIVEVDALDCLDDTPVIDLKPWRQGVDVLPDAASGG